MLGARIAFDRPAPGGYVVPPTVLGIVGLLTVMAYAIWFFPILLHGRVMMERDELNQMPGITSFTQMGIPFVLCYAHCALTSGQRFPRIVRWELYLILFLTFARVFIWSERLAMIEVMVPAAVVVLTQARVPRGPWRRARSVLAAFGPYLAVPILIGGFTVTEYFRSWKTYSHTQSLPLVDFMVSRVVTYYFTALNNGAGFLATQVDEWPTYHFLYVLTPIYCLPAGIGEGLRTLVTGHQEWPHFAFLQSYADVEFNNMSGIFPYMHDMGLVGACVYFAASGLVAGTLYRSLMRGGKVGAMLYPSVFVACVEVLRISYLNGPRIVLVFVGALLLLGQMRGARAANVWAA
jgi:hypothetical protein